MMSIRINLKHNKCSNVKMDCVLNQGPPLVNGDYEIEIQEIKLSSQPSAGPMTLRYCG